MNIVADPASTQMLNATHPWRPLTPLLIATGAICISIFSKDSLTSVAIIGIAIIISSRPLPRPVIETVSIRGIIISLAILFGSFVMIALLVTSTMPLPQLRRADEKLWSVVVNYDSLNERLWRFLFVQLHGVIISTYITLFRAFDLTFEISLFVRSLIVLA